MRIKKVEIKKEDEYIKFAFGDEKTMNVFLLESEAGLQTLRTAVTAQTIDWEQRRYEIAKDLYSSCERNDSITAIRLADEFIKELKGESK